MDRGVWQEEGHPELRRHGRAQIGKNLKQPSAPTEQAAQAWGGNVEAGWAAGGQALGPQVCWVLRGLRSYSEELDSAPCGHSAPLCSPHVLS